MTISEFICIEEHELDFKRQLNLTKFTGSFSEEELTKKANSHPSSDIIQSITMIIIIMRILTIMSEEEEESIHDNANLSNSEEEEVSTEPEIKPVVAPELEPEPEVEIISSVTEKSGVEVAAKTKPKKQTKSIIMKIQTSLADTSKQIEKQTAQFNKISQNLQTLQKQFKLGQKQSEILIQICSQINQIQRQTSQVQKSIKRR